MSKKIILSIAIIVMMILAAVLVVNRDDNQNYLIDTEKQEGNPENNFIDSFFDGGQDVQEADIENVLDKTFSALLEPLSYSYISKDYDFETGEFENAHSGNFWQSGTTRKLKRCLKSDSCTTIIFNKGIVYWEEYHKDEGIIKIKRRSSNYDKGIVANIFRDIITDASVTDVVTWLINGLDIKYFGEENLNGIDTVVIGGSYNPEEKTTKKVKLWIWKDKGIVVKSDIITIEPSSSDGKDEMNRKVFEMSNFDFDKVDINLIRTLDGAQVNIERVNFEKDSKFYLYVDDDKDGISNTLEKDIFNTNPDNIDTDNDGYNDGVEIEGGYNPGGVGKMSNEYIQKIILYRK